MEGIDERIDRYQENIIRFYQENEPFFVNYLFRPALFELLFHGTFAKALRHWIIAIMIIDRFILMINRSQLKGLQVASFLLLVLAPNYIDHNPYMNIALYAILTDMDMITGISQALLGYAASHNYGIVISSLMLSASNIFADSYKIVYLLNNNQRYLFYISWNQLRGYTLKAILVNRYREYRDFMDTLLERVLCPLNLNQ